jgi:hypothetical protein
MAAPKARSVLGKPGVIKVLNVMFFFLEVGCDF